MRLYLKQNLTKAMPPSSKPPKAPKPPGASAASPPSASGTPPSAATPPSAGGSQVEYDYWYPQAGQTTPPGTGWQPLEGSNGYKRPKGMGGMSVPTPQMPQDPSTQVQTGSDYRRTVDPGMPKASQPVSTKQTSGLMPTGAIDDDYDPDAATFKAEEKTMADLKAKNDAFNALPFEEQQRQVAERAKQRDAEYQKRLDAIAAQQAQEEAQKTQTAASVPTQQPASAAPQATSGMAPQVPVPPPPASSSSTQAAPTSPTQAPVSPYAKTEPQLKLDPKKLQEAVSKLDPNAPISGPPLPKKMSIPNTPPGDSVVVDPKAVQAAASKLDPNAPISGPPPKQQPTGTAAFDPEALSKVHTNTDADTHEKLADIHAQQGNQEHAAWHKDQAASKKSTPKGSSSESKTLDEPKKKKHTVNDISQMSHKEQAGSLAESIQSHIDGNQELTPKQKEIAQALLSAAQYHANADELHPEAKKELSQLASIARKHGLHKPFKNPQDYETLDGESEAPKGSTDWLAKFHEGRARGQGLAASSGSAYAAGHIGSQMGNYVSTEAVTQGHRLLTSGKKTTDDPGSSKAEAARAVSQAEKDVRLANKQRF